MVRNENGVLVVFGSIAYARAFPNLNARSLYIYICTQNLLDIYVMNYPYQAWPKT